VNDEIAVWNLAFTQLLYYISHFTNEISGNNMTVYRLGVGKYIKSHKMCSRFWKALLFQDNVIIKTSTAQDIYIYIYIILYYTFILISNWSKLEL